jgi:hypothetical protein
MAAARQVAPRLFVIPIGIVNSFLIHAPDRSLLANAGLHGRDADIIRGANPVHFHLRRLTNGAQGAILALTSVTFRIAQS